MTEPICNSISMGRFAGTSEVSGINLIDNNQGINFATKRDRSYSLDGSMDDVRIYQDALNPQQINRLINIGTIEVPEGKEIEVYFRTKDPDTDGEITINDACVTGATFIDGTPVNDDCDTAQVAILDAGSISGYLWSDLDGDGWRGTVGYETGEPGIPAVRIVLETCSVLGGSGSCRSGFETDTIFTDATGAYSFDGLIPGKYYRVGVISGDIPDSSPQQRGDPDDDPVRGSGNGGTCGNGGANALCDDLWDNDGNWFVLGTDSWGSESMDLTEINFGYLIDGVIFGQLWEDVNGDGIRQTGEPGIVGAVVSLSNGSTATTDSEGNYSFGDLGIGSYTVSVSLTDLPDVGRGWNQTAESDGSINNGISFKLGSGAISGSHDFGFHPEGLSIIGDQLYFDWNGNGTHDSNEEGIPNITVSLYRDNNRNGIKDPSDSFIDTVSTDADGVYNFRLQPRGNYLVIVDEADPQFPPTTQTGDPDDYGTCSNCDGIDSLNIDGSSSYLSSDFGYMPVGAGSIGDLVWYDTNGDGSQEGLSETGIPLITVFLYADLNEDGTYSVVDSTETDGNGNYEFGNLPDGAYQIVVDSVDSDMPQGRWKQFSQFHNRFPEYR